MRRSAKGIKRQITMQIDGRKNMPEQMTLFENASRRRPWLQSSTVGRQFFAEYHL
jgi:hypothetical protein